ncbi:speckle targeted PIP5K1A-regulated poly(A) polymerase isoform X1 [Pelobates fuscus]|uniref:speckle targeted PIP5K1A-regulated poly(A) polymerase isoform X1 n=1 Tax=Pelobates fuscus TaxID=191477 RepID=UPI002FE43390
MAADVQAVPEDVRSADRGGYRCLLCGVSIPNRPSLTDHLRGRRHVRLCEERDKRQQQQERSVYVRGFPRDTTEEQLMDVFQALSPVKSIVMDKDSGFYAIVEFENNDGVSLSLAAPNLRLGEKQLKVKPREKKEFQRKKGAGPRKLQPPDPEALSKELVQCTDVEDQMKKLVSLCSPSHQESHLRQLLLSLLQETFTEFFPGCQLLAFGSSVNGFEISGCDLDLYLELGESDCEEKVKIREDPDGEVGEKIEGDAEVQEIKKQINLLDESDELEKEDESKEEEMKSAEESEEDEEEVSDVTPGLSLQGLSSEEVLELVEKVLRRCVPGVHGVQSVPSARRPVIRFQHKTSGLRGDITLNNRLALRNSSFLRLCSDLDPRVPQLVYTVRYWARVHQLAGNPLGGGPLLNNYALTLLVVFFLQTRSPPVIPTLNKLREEAVNEVPQVINGWDCTFLSDINKIQTSGNQQSLSCLLSEFFSFFSSLDLASVILCPCSGSILPLPLSSPSSWLDGFRLGRVNVQDPFELSHNVCGNVSSRTARHFASQCTSTAQTCRTSLYRLRSRCRPWGITLIFLPALSDEEKKANNVAEIVVPLGAISFEVAFSVTKKVFQDVLLCTCEEEEAIFEKGQSTTGETNKTQKGRESVLDEEMVMEVVQAVPCKEEYTEKQEQGNCKNWIKSEAQGKKRERTDLSKKDIVTKKMKTEESGDDSCRSHCENAQKHEDSDCVRLLRVCVWHQVWEGRRKERRRRRGGEAKGIELETEISRALCSVKGESMGEEPLIILTVNFQLTAQGQTQLCLTSTADTHGLGPVFFHFLEGFLPRIVRESLATRE